MKRAKTKGKEVQQRHRSWSQQSLEARNDKQVLVHLEHLLERSPRPKQNESEKRWGQRCAKYVREFKSFFAQHRLRLQRLGIRIEDFGLLQGNEKSVRFLSEAEDPRYVEAEERETLGDLANKGLVRYKRLG